jgi:NAD(P)H-nitrite reductase large subunit
VGHAKVEAVVLSNGKKLKTDAVLVNIGISFNVEWLGGSGITLENGVVVNQYLETDVPDVYAAGDLALFYDPLIELYHQQGNWSNATLQGQIAGQNMTGHKAEFAAVTSYSVHLMKTDISFIGQTSLRSSLTAVPRGSARTGAYGRILLRSGQVVGATLINRFVDRDPIQRLISSQIKVDRYIAALADESISLKDVANALGV